MPKQKWHDTDSENESDEHSISSEWWMIMLKNSDEEIKGLMTGE